MSAPPPDDTTFVLAPAAGCSWLGGELVVLDPSGQVLHGINARGAQVLSRLDGRTPVKQIGLALDAVAEVEAFLARLEAAGIVVRAGSVQPPAVAVAVAAAHAVGAPEILWEQRFVGLQELSDPCATQNPPPGYCGSSSRFGDFGGS